MSDAGIYNVSYRITTALVVSHLYITIIKLLILDSLYNELIVCHLFKTTTATASIL